MILEIYIDTEELTNNQSLAILDDQGKRWDVEEALVLSSGASEDGSRGQSRPKVVLERWQIQLGEPSKELSKDLSVILPRVYKNSIVLFRSLLAFAKLLPAWRLAPKTSRSRSTPQSPKIKYQIVEASQFRHASKVDPLTVRLLDVSSAKARKVDEVVEHYAFDPIDSPAGPFSIQVTYRLHCDFRIDDSEALLSSHFIGMDEQFFEPSLGRDRGADLLGKQNRARGAEAGSLPQRKRGSIEQPDQSQAYGSMSTFHQVGPAAGSSPLSALRAARDRTSQSPPEALQSKAPPSHRLSHGSRSSLRSSDGPSAIGRRPSVSFMPFKTPSLSASPSQGEQAGSSLPRGSLGRTPALGSLAEARIPPQWPLKALYPPVDPRRFLIRHHHPQAQVHQNLRYQGIAVASVTARRSFQLVAVARLRKTTAVAERVSHLLTLNRALEYSQKVEGAARPRFRLTTIIFQTSSNYSIRRRI